jgi:hypothetical protein
LRFFRTTDDDDAIDADDDADDDDVDDRVAPDLIENNYHRKDIRRY